MAVTLEDMKDGVRRLGLSGKALVVHSSVRSFGPVAGGPKAIVEGLLAEGCTVLVPTFSSDAYEMAPPPGWRLARNGHVGDQPEVPSPGNESIYTPQATEIDSDMGAVPKAVVAMPGHVRSPHPLRSCAAVGARAAELMPEGAPIDLFGPFDKLAGLDGWGLLMGVGLNRMTAMHHAEQMMGRRMLQRWTNGPDGHLLQVEVGGCGEGFVRMAEFLSPIEQQTSVGEALWRAFPLKRLLAIVSNALQEDPNLSHCDKPHCVRCDDVIAGGPVLATNDSR